MQEARALHRPAQDQALVRQGKGAALGSPQGEQLDGLDSVAAESPLASRLAQLAAMAEAGPVLAAQRRLAGMIDDSPRMAAQRVEVPTKSNHTGMPDKLKSGIESLSGIAMDNVRVHYNSSQPAQLNALAYAQGSDIHLAPGQEKHLPHEAWHVVQQAQGRVKPTVQMKEGVPVNDDQGLEREADAMGAKALQLKRADFGMSLDRVGPGAFPVNASGKVLQRSPRDFEDHPVSAIEGSGIIYKNWDAIKAEVEAYTNLTDINVEGRKAQLKLIKDAMEKWRVENEVYSKALNALSENRQLKENALQGLDADLRREWAEIIHIAGTDANTLGTLAVPGGQQVSNDPLLTRTVKGSNQSWGFFKAGAHLYKSDRTEITQPTAGHACLLVAEGAPNGRQPSDYFKVKESKEAAAIGTKAVIDNGIVFKDDVWVKRTEVISGKMTVARTDLEYADAYSPIDSPLFPHAARKDDVEQNGLGDCYLLAAVMAIVSTRPDHFRDNMKDNLDGTVTVRLYDVAAGVFTPRLVTVKKTYVKKKNSAEPGFAGGPLWVSMLEKAYAAAGFQGGSSDTMNVHTGSYGMIEGGHPKYAMEHILGVAADKKDIEAPAGNAAIKDWSRLLMADNPPAVGGMQMISIQSHIETSLGGDWTTFIASEQPRREQFDALIARVPDSDNPSVAEGMPTVVDWLRQNIFPGKRGSGVYVAYQMDMFRDIAAQVSANRPVTLSTKEKVVSGGDDGGLSGEHVGKGLAGPHAYMVLDFYPRPIPNVIAPNQLFWLKIRNPWGRVQDRSEHAPHPGRVYRDKHTDEVLDQPYDQPRTHGDDAPVGNRIGAQGSDNPEFWIELSDATKRFGHYDHVS